MKDKDIRPLRGVAKIGDEKIVLFGAGSEDTLEVTTKSGHTFKVSREKEGREGQP